jgi:hypothetical protein
VCDRHNVHGKEDRGNVYSQVSWEKIYSETVGQDKELVYCTTGILTPDEDNRKDCMWGR